MAKIMFIGDVHANKSYFIQCLRMAKMAGIKDIIQVGDLGWYPTYASFPEDIPISEDLNVYWIDGNHEEHEAIKEGKLPKNLIYCPRGSSLTLHGRKFLFLGGAHSIDYKINTVGWSILENITQEDLDTAMSHDDIEIVVTHEAPQELNLKGMNEVFAALNGFDLKSRGNREKLQELLEAKKPKLWFFGHWHYTQRYEAQGCKCYVIGGEQEHRHPRVLILDTETLSVKVMG